MNKSQIFKKPTKLAKSVHVAGDCYRVTFGAALKIVIAESKLADKEKNARLIMSPSVLQQIVVTPAANAVVNLVKKIAKETGLRDQYAIADLIVANFEKAKKADKSGRMHLALFSNYRTNLQQPTTM
jgi:hypothetical protein